MGRKMDEAWVGPCRRHISGCGRLFTVVARHLLLDQGSADRVGNTSRGTKQCSGDPIVSMVLIEAGNDLLLTTNEPLSDDHLYDCPLSAVNVLDDLHMHSREEHIVSRSRRRATL